MSDTPPIVLPPAPPPAGSDARTLPVVIYGLYLAGFVSGGLTTLIGLLMAIALRDEGLEQNPIKLDRTLLKTPYI